MRYSIGDVSRVLGMTTSALHFYEKEGIIDTPKEESGRRYYEDKDVCRLISAKKYRAMGVPVRDIALQFSHDGMDGGQVIARMREKRDEAAQQARRYERLAQDIDCLIKRCGVGVEAVNTVDICRAEDMLMFCSSSKSWIPVDKTEQTLVKCWLEAMPSVFLSICKDQPARPACPALMTFADSGREFGLKPDGRNVFLVPGGMALHAVVVCGEEMYETPDVIFRPVMAFAREHRFVQKGTMWGNMLLADCSGGVRKHYFETYMVFE